MPREVLRGRVQHVVDAIVDGTHVIGRRQGRIDQRFDFIRLANGDELFQVDGGQMRVGW